MWVHHNMPSSSSHMGSAASPTPCHNFMITSDSTIGNRTGALPTPHLMQHIHTYTMIVWGESGYDSLRRVWCSCIQASLSGCGESEASHYIKISTLFQTGWNGKRKRVVARIHSTSSEHVSASRMHTYSNRHMWAGAEPLTGEETQTHSERHKAC